jgi:peptidyl-prolyl cis-trans isomerase A (cyclophilin A)
LSGSLSSRAIEASMRKSIQLWVVAALFCVFSLSSAAAGTITVVMKTSAGDIRIELYPDAAPVTVENFLKYVDGGYYKNARFYRVVRMDNQAQNNIKIEVIQGGLGMDESDSPFAPIAHETTRKTGLLHRDGVISMGRLEPGTASSEFFICINDQPELDFGGQRNPDGQGFAAFGQVVEGMETVRLIQSMPTEMPQGEQLEYTSGQILIDPVVIFEINRAGDSME